MVVISTYSGHQIRAIKLTTCVLRDGRDRMKDIKVPVFMLTGEYDWSNTPDMTVETAKKIPGSRHKSMPGLGHFPATENPKKFTGFLQEAVDWIMEEKK